MTAMVQSGLQDGDLHVKLGHCAVATPASGSYLPQSRYNPSELLRGLTLEEQLVIPAMSIHASAATLKLSAVEVEELDTTLTAASVTLTEAAALLIKAAGTAGVAQTSGGSAMRGFRSALPLVSHLVAGVPLDAHKAKASLKNMKEAEVLLEDFWRQVQGILKSLQGTVEMSAPAAPLALTCLLGCITPSSTCSLQTCSHPVIQALYLGQTGGVGAASTNQGGPGYTYTRCAYPNAGWNGVRPGIGMYCGTRPGIIRTVLGSTITAARGTDRHLTSTQVGQRELAQHMAPAAANADSLEVQRLIEQTEELRAWLHHH